MPTPRRPGVPNPDEESTSLFRESAKIHSQSTRDSNFLVSSNLLRIEFSKKYPDIHIGQKEWLCMKKVLLPNFFQELEHIIDLMERIISKFEHASKETIEKFAFLIKIIETICTTYGAIKSHTGRAPRGIPPKTFGKLTEIYNIIHNPKKARQIWDDVPPEVRTASKKDLEVVIASVISPRNTPTHTLAPAPVMPPPPV